MTTGWNIIYLLASPHDVATLLIGFVGLQTWHKGKLCYCIRSTYFPFAEKAFVCSSLMCNLKNHNWGHIICLAEQPDCIYCLHITACNVMSVWAKQPPDVICLIQLSVWHTRLYIFFMTYIHTTLQREVLYIYRHWLFLFAFLSLSLCYFSGGSMAQKGRGRTANVRWRAWLVSVWWMLLWLSGVAPKKKALLLPEICLTSSDVTLYFREQTLSEYR